MKKKLTCFYSGSYVSRLSFMRLIFFLVLSVQVRVSYGEVCSLGKPLSLNGFSEVAVLQQKEKLVRGVVRGEDGSPIWGVTVVEKGVANGTVTGFAGEFSLKVYEDAQSLQFSFIGMKTLEVSIVGKSQISVVMREDVEALNEIVLVGYATSKRKDLTGSVSSVSGGLLEDIPVPSVAQALSGRMAGVQVTTTEGGPGAEIKIRIRGGGSITQDNSPLYIVDGFAMTDISAISPNEIKSIDVLKDASSTAIYGARGANGVVIITTKSAKGGKLKVEYTGYSGIKRLSGKLDVLTPYQFALSQYEAQTIRNRVETGYDSYFGAFEDIELYKHMDGTNWQDKVFGRTGTTQSHSLSMTGGSKEMKFALTYSRLNDKAIMARSSFDRDNLNLKLKMRPLKWLRFNWNVRYSNSKIRGAGTNDVQGTEKSTSDSRLKYSVVYTPIPLQNVTLQDDEEEYLGSLVSPLTQIDDNYREKHDQYFILNGGVIIMPLKGMSIRSSIGLNNRYIETNRFYGLSTYYVRSGDAVYKNAPASEMKNAKYFTLTNTNTISYHLDNLWENKNHKLDILLGNENYNRDQKVLTNITENFPVFFDAEDAWSFSTEGNAISTKNHYSPSDKLISFFTRANYSYSDKYLLTATFRADGSSKFAPGNRWGYFPAAALAWRISEESFVKGASNWLDDLKLRVSYGVSGNNRIPALSYLQTYSSVPTSYLPTELATSYWGAGNIMSNPDLKWETTISRNLGLDFDLFDSRISGVFELYNNTTKDLLINFPVTGSGYNTQLRNIGETRNKGVEISINTDIIRKKDFNVNFSANFNRNINEVVSLGGLEEITANAKWTSDAEASQDYKVTVGESIGQMYGFVTDGWYTEDDFTRNGGSWDLKAGLPDNSYITGKTWGPGALKLKDLDGNGVIDNGDRTIIGNNAPKFTGGFNLSVNYKGLDISANFYGSFGQDIYNANRIELTAGKHTYRNMLAEMAPGKRYTQMDYTTGQMVTDVSRLAEMNKDASIWAPVSGRFVFHSWAVEDGSFLRFNNLTVGYTLPSDIISKGYLQRLRIYMSMSNIYTWTKYSGNDPEVDSRRATGLTPGVDYSAYPRNRSVSIGLNITF